MDVLPSEYYQVAYVNIGQVVDVLTALAAQWRRRDLARPVSQRPAQPRQPGEHPPWRQSPTREEAVGSSVILYIAEPQS